MLKKIIKILNIITGWMMVAWGAALIVDMFLGTGIIGSTWALSFTIILTLSWVITHLLINN